MSPVLVCAFKRPIVASSGAACVPMPLVVSRLASPTVSAITTAPDCGNCRSVACTCSEERLSVMLSWPGICTSVTWSPVSTSDGAVWPVAGVRRSSVVMPPQRTASVPPTSRPAAKSTVVDVPVTDKATAPSDVTPLLNCTLAAASMMRRPPLRSTTWLKKVTVPLAWM